MKLSKIVIAAAVVATGASSLMQRHGPGQGTVLPAAPTGRGPLRAERCAVGQSASRTISR